MTKADASAVASPVPGGPRPRPAAGICAELAETPAGWVLTLHSDSATAQILRAVGADLQKLGQLSVSIKPNLVPGEPFAIETVLVETDRPR